MPAARQAGWPIQLGTLARIAKPSKPKGRKLTVRTVTSPFLEVTVRIFSSPPLWFFCFSSLCSARWRKGAHLQQTGICSTPKGLVFTTQWPHNKRARIYNTIGRINSRSGYITAPPPPTCCCRKRARIHVKRARIYVKRVRIYVTMFSCVYFGCNPDLSSPFCFKRKVKQNNDASSRSKIDILFDTMQAKTPTPSPNPGQYFKRLNQFSPTASVAARPWG